MSDLFEKAEDELARQYNDGEITRKEYNTEMRELARELNYLANEAAEQARSDVLGGGW